MAWVDMPKRIHYALKGLCCLAMFKQPMRAAELARYTRIHPSQAAKTLYLLTWGGFVGSRRGAKGGFWLRRSPEQIRLRDVVQFFSPPEEKGEDGQGDPVLDVWEQAAARTHEAFEQLTLADLVRRGRTDRLMRRGPDDKDTWQFFA